MDKIILTNDADYMICSMYDEYIRRIKNGSPKEDAKYFGGAEKIQETILQEWSIYDISETACQLRTVGFLSIKNGDNILCESALTTDAIVYMENRFKDKANSVLDTLAKLRSIIKP